VCVRKADPAKRTLPVEHRPRRDGPPHHEGSRIHGRRSYTPHQVYSSRMQSSPNGKLLHRTAGYARKHVGVPPARVKDPHDRHAKGLQRIPADHVQVTRNMVPPNATTSEIRQSSNR